MPRVVMAIKLDGTNWLNTIHGHRSYTIWFTGVQGETSDLVHRIVAKRKFAHKLKNESTEAKSSFSFSWTDFWRQKKDILLKLWSDSSLQRSVLHSIQQSRSSTGIIRESKIDEVRVWVSSHKRTFKISTSLIHIFQVHGLGF